MSIHVARQASLVGVFTSEEIAAGLLAGRFLPSDLGWREGMPAWLALGEWAEFRTASVPPLPDAFVGASTPGSSVEVLPAWERGASFGNFFATIRDVALNPVRTFDALPAGDYGKPIRFAYAMYLPLWLVVILVLGILCVAMADLFPASELPALIRGASPGVIFIVGSGLAALWLLLSPLLHFIGAGAIHLLLLPWGPKGGFAQTYRASSYAYNAFLPFQLIPCVNYVAWVWQLVVVVIAQARTHRLDWWKVLISLILTPCCLCCLSYGLILAVGAASG